MAWGAKDTSTQLTTITATEQFFDDLISVDVNEYADVHVMVNHGGTTDDAIVSLYGTLDATSETWDGVPFMSRYIVQATQDSDWFQFTVSGVYKFRIGVKSTGATDSHTADMSHRVATP
jgi:hypothetical protein